MNEFWDPRRPRPSAEFQALLVEYSGIPKDRVIDHIEQIRSQGWSVETYPCIGMYVFIELSMSQHPAYAKILESLRSDLEDTTLLDLGCCLGQDLRKLVHDGASGRRLIGYDIEPRFFSVGYEAFRDNSRLQAQFISGNFLEQAELATSGKSDGKEASNPSPEQILGPRYDFIHAADVFHLWSWEKQVQVSRKDRMERLA